MSETASAAQLVNGAFTQFSLEYFLDVVITFVALAVTRVKICSTPVSGRNQNISSLHHVKDNKVI